MKQSISPERLVLLIQEAKNKPQFFTVTTRKRSDGTLRKFMSRKKAYKRRGKRPYNPNNRGLIHLYDYTKGEDGNAKGWRSLNIDDLVEARIGGVHYVVARPHRTVISIYQIVSHV